MGSAHRLSDQSGLDQPWGDEEWILLADEVKYQGMLSINYPLALLTPLVLTKARGIDLILDIVEITDLLDENLSANTDLGQRLPSQGICDHDLFAESV